MHAFGFRYIKDDASALVAGTEYGTIFTRVDPHSTDQFDDLDLVPATDADSLREVVDHVTDLFRRATHGRTIAAVLTVADDADGTTVLTELEQALAGNPLSFVAAQQNFVEITRGAATTAGVAAASAVPFTHGDDTPVTLPDDAELLRPNGEAYRPRRLGIHTDVAVLRHLRRLPRPVHVLLGGPAGSGKTALAEVAHSDLITINGHEDMTVAHIVGQLMPTDAGGWQFVEGPLVRAMSQGRALLIDEINRIPSEVLAVIHPAADGRGYVRLDDRPDDPIVTAAEGFCLVGTFNPDSLGSNGLSEALTSRFTVSIDVSTDYQAARQLGVPGPFVKVAENLHSLNRANPEQQPVWVPQMRELLAAKGLVDAGLGFEFAASAMLAQCPVPEDVPIVAEKLGDALGLDRPAPLTLEGQVGAGSRPATEPAAV